MTRADKTLPVVYSQRMRALLLFILPLLLPVFGALSTATAASNELILPNSTPAEATPPAAPETKAAAPVINVDTSAENPSAYALERDSVTKDTIIATTAEDTVVQRALPLLTGSVPPLVVPDSLTLTNETYLSIGAGWSLGSNRYIKLWESSLPDSLGKCGLTNTSFRFFFDSSLAGPQPDQDDTANIALSVKEKPALYSITFPLSVSLTRMRVDDRISITLNGSWLHKLFKATVATVGDSVDRKVDISETLNMYSLFIDLTYGHVIPPLYFSIDGIDKTYGSVGIGFSPLIFLASHQNVVAYGGNSSRMGKVAERIKSVAVEHSIHGTSAAFRCGLTTVKHLSTRQLLNVDIGFSMNWYGFFYEAGERVYSADINRTESSGGDPLSWVSNRFDLSFSLMRRVAK